MSNIAQLRPKVFHEIKQDALTKFIAVLHKKEAFIEQWILNVETGCNEMLDLIDLSARNASALNNAQYAFDQHADKKTYRLTAREERRKAA